MQPMNDGRDDPQMARLDPSTSRLKYRLERLMLTPGVRATLRVGLPMALAFGAASWWFSVEANRDAFNLMISDVRAQVEDRPEFQVRLMAIDGASANVAEDIRAVLPIEFPMSSFDLDMDEMRRTVVALDAVRKATLRIKQGGVLQIDVTERVPAVLWRHDKGLDLLDRRGIRVGPAESRAAHVRLPVIAGEAAEQAVPEALALSAVAGPLRARLRGFERMSGRRWDVVLDRGQRIMLPETGAVRAFERVIAMQQARSVRLLDRDVIAVDLRLSQRPTIRMSEDATEALRTFREIDASGD